MKAGEVFFIAVGQIDNEPAVLGFATHRVDDARDGGSVYVRGVATRRGIGSALWRMVEAHAIASGATSIQLIPWKTFEVVYELRVPVSSPAPGRVDWALYEKERTWWRNVLELGGCTGYGKSDVATSNLERDSVLSCEVGSDEPCA
jgi:GNAT superfamily N-acetyltransferase